MKKQVSARTVHKPFGPYSIGIEAGKLLFLSGQGPFDQEQHLVGSTIEEQTLQTMNNIQMILAENDCVMDDIVKVTVFLQDIQTWGAFNEIYRTFFTDPMPARTVVACQLNGFLVEVDVIVVKSSSA